MSTVTYVAGADLDDLTVTWNDSDGTIIDFASGWTFSVKVGIPGSAALFTKSTGITGAATAPNLTVAWATTGELNSLTRGVYVVQITATRTSDSKQRIMQTSLQINDAIT